MFYTLNLCNRAQTGSRGIGPLTILPDDEEPEAAEVLVDAQAGGRFYRFMLDTGAARTSLILDETTAAFESLESGSASGLFGNREFDLIRLPEFRLGPICKTDFVIQRRRDSRPEVRNLLGMDFLKEHCCCFLFDRQRLWIDPPAHGAADFQPLLFDAKFHPCLEMQIAGAAAWAVWDSGAGMSVVDLGFVRRHPALFEEDGASNGSDSTGAELQTPVYRMAACRIGGLDFPAQRVAAFDLERVNAAIDLRLDFILGYSTFRRANWVFDFPRQRWAASKIEQPGGPNAPAG